VEKGHSSIILKNSGKGNKRTMNRIRVDGGHITTTGCSRKKEKENQKEPTSSPEEGDPYPEVDTEKRSKSYGPHTPLVETGGPSKLAPLGIDEETRRRKEGVRDLVGDRSHKRKRTTNGSASKPARRRMKKTREVGSAKENERGQGVKKGET